MKTLFKIAILVSTLILPCSAFAKSKAGDAQSHCLMMGDAAAMQKDMDSMMSDMDTMMKTTADPGMKDRMQKMHDQMAKMSSKMGKMGGNGMMDGKSMGMTGDKPVQGE
jgi:hypothetical protein